MEAASEYTNQDYTQKKLNLNQISDWRRFYRQISRFQSQKRIIKIHSFSFWPKNFDRLRKTMLSALFKRHGQNYIGRSIMS